MTTWELLARGGAAMWPLYGCALIVALVAVQRLLVVRTLRLRDLGWVDAVLSAAERGAWDDAGQAAAKTRHPGGATLQAAAQTMHDRPARALAEGRRVAAGEVAELERFLGLLSFLAQAAPLIGLLGTVIGMVELFLELQTGGANLDVDVLARGIWKALLTTAGGLVVALPALAAHAWLSSTADRLRAQLTDLLERFATAAHLTDGRAATAATAAAAAPAAVERAA